MNFFFQKSDFKPNKLDMRFPLIERFGNDSIVCCNLFNSSIEYSLVNINRDEYNFDLPLKRKCFENIDALPEVFDEIHQEYETPYISCTINSDFEILLLQKAIQEPPLSEQSLYDSATLGPTYEKDRKFIHFSNIYYNKTLLFSFSRHHILQLTDAINKGGFTLAQLGCGVYNLLRYNVYEVEKTERNINALLIISQKCVVLLKLQNSDWVEVSFRHIFDQTSLLETISSLIERLAIDGNINCYSMLNDDILEKLRNNMPLLNIKCPSYESPDGCLRIMHNLYVQ